MEEKKITGNDLIISLGSEDFRQYFRRNILPHLEPIERFRVELNKKKTAFIAISFIADVIIILVFLFFKITINPGLPILIPVSGWVIASAWAKKKFKESTGKRIIPALFSYWGTFEYCKEPNYSPKKAFELLKQLKVYEKYDDIKIDDCIEGSYNGLELKITEFDISYGSGKNSVQVFDGLMMEVDMNKNFTSHTIIETNYKKPAGRAFQRINLEDPEFEKEFDVYSTDQIDSRYILTTAFMRRLVELKMAVKQCIEVVFWSHKTYIFINYKEDKFELPLNKPVTEMKHYQNILLDLARILKVVDALKLEQNIGL